MEDTVQDSAPNTEDVSAEEYSEESNESINESGSNEDTQDETTQRAIPEGDDKPRAKPKQSNQRKAIEEGEEEAAARQAEADLSEEQVGALVNQLGLPKGVEYYQDKSGKWQFIIPMDGKKYKATMEDVFRGFNLNQVGHQRLQQSKTAERKMQEYFDSMREDPEKFWQLADKVYEGTDYDKHLLAQKLLERAVADAELTPEQREQRDRLEEAERIKRENEELHRREQERQYQAMVDQERKSLSEEFITAMGKHGLKPFNPEESPGETRKRCAIMAHAVGLMSLANQQGRNMNADDALFIAKQEWQAYIQDVFRDIDPQRYKDWVPEDVIQAIRNDDISRISKGRIPTASSGDLGGPVDLEEYVEETPQRQKRKQTINEFFANM